MHLKKPFTVLSVLLIFILAMALLSGCGSTPDNSSDEEQGDAEISYLFDRGVWAASIDGEVDTYFLFTDKENGRTEKADGTGGVPFTCEQNGTDVVFHFGSADDVTNAKFSTGDNTGTFEFEDQTVVYFFEYVNDADPDNFEVPAE